MTVFVKAAIAKLEKIRRYNNQLRYNQTSKGKANQARGNNKRRAAMAIESTLTAGEWESIKRQYKNKCIYCGAKKPLTMDHIIPISRGGHHIKENVVPACKSCNSIKGNRPMLLQMLALADGIYCGLKSIKHYCT